MQIVCPACSTAYEVGASALGDSGRSVRCVRCHSVWFAAPAPEPAAIGASANEMAAMATAGTADMIGMEDTAGNAWPGEAASSGASAMASPGEAGQPPGLAQAATPGSEAMLQDTFSIDDAPPLAPADDHFAQGFNDPALTDTPSEDIETVAARRARKENWHYSHFIPQSRLSKAIVALVALNAGLIVWRADMVRMFPQTGSLYALMGLPVNLRGLDILEVKTAHETNDGVPVIVIDGVVANVTKKSIEAPRLRFAVRDNRSAELYVWTLLSTRAVLGPGEKLPFHSRLASPPAEGREVLVRFVNQRDIAAGLR